MQHRHLEILYLVYKKSQDTQLHTIVLVLAGSDSIGGGVLFKGEVRQ